MRGARGGDGGPRGGRLGAWAAWLPAALVAAWALVRLTGLERPFALVPLMAYTPYVAAAAVVPVVAALAVRRLAAASVGAVALIVLAALVLPRAFGGEVAAEPPDGPSLRVMTLNLHYGRADAERVAELVRELDVDALAVQELTRRGVGTLAATGLGRQLAHRELRLGAGAAGAGVYSRYPLEPAGPAERLPGGFILLRVLLDAPAADEVELASVHTAPPTGWGRPSWADDLGALPAASPSPLRILAGDFNATLDHATFRELLDRGYADAGDEAGAGLIPTWPHGRVLPPPVTIDHVLTDERIGVGDYSVHDVPGTDHRAVFAELTLPAG